MMENDFEKYWRANKRRLLEANDDYKRVVEGYKMTSGADWLLFAFPFVAAIVVMNRAPFDKELLNWLAGAGAALIAFVICVWIKSRITYLRPMSEIEDEVKRAAYEEFVKHHSEKDDLGAVNADMAQ